MASKNGFIIDAKNNVIFPKTTIGNVVGLDELLLRYVELNEEAKADLWIDSSELPHNEQVL